MAQHMVQYLHFRILEFPLKLGQLEEICENSQPRLLRKQYDLSGESSAGHTLES